MNCSTSYPYVRSFEGKRILIVKMSSLGDVILASPSAEVLKKAEGDLFIGWLVEERNKEVLEGNPFVDEIFTWRRTLGDIPRALRALRRYRWDICLDLQGLFKSGIFCFLSGAKEKIARGRVERGAQILYSYIIPPLQESHVVRSYIFSAYLALYEGGKRGGGMGEAIKRTRMEEARPHVYLSEEERRKVDDLLGGDMPFVVLCPGTTWASKRWLAGRWARVADAIVEMGYRVVFLGAKGDIPTILSIRGKMKLPCLDLTGKTTLRESASILERAKLVISVDSGAMHLASAVDAPVLALFGPTNPLTHGPYGEGNRVIYKNVGCSPCRNRKCASQICMKMISEEEVIGLVKEML